MYINPQGSPTAKVWIVTERPFKQDEDKGYLWSGGYGRLFNSMLNAVGINNYYVISRAPDLDSPSTFHILENDLEYYRPPVIIPVEDSGMFFCSALIKNEFSKRKLTQGESEVHKYCGSILESPKCQYPHIIIPTYGPERIMSQYKLKDIVTFLDLGKAAEELAYYEANNGKFRSLPIRTLQHDFTDFDELLQYLVRFEGSTILSNDIEVVYPKTKDSLFWGHPGLPTVIGLADSKDFGISFPLFRGEDRIGRIETRELWRRLQRLFDIVPFQLGQNFFQFDLYRYEMLGFRIDKTRIHDTKIRQHILWPELKKDLAFMTRQYTREPFYKDDGHTWSFKNMSLLRKYNCKDVCVTFEVFEAQEEEFAKRPWLK